MRIAKLTTQVVYVCNEQTELSIVGKFMQLH